MIVAYYPTIAPVTSEHLVNLQVNETYRDVSLPNTMSTIGDRIALLKICSSNSVFQAILTNNGHPNTQFGMALQCVIDLSHNYNASHDNHPPLSSNTGKNTASAMDSKPAHNDSTEAESQKCAQALAIERKVGWEDMIGSEVKKDFWFRGKIVKCRVNETDVGPEILCGVVYDDNDGEELTLEELRRQPRDSGCDEPQGNTGYTFWKRFRIRGKVVRILTKKRGKNGQCSMKRSPVHHNYLTSSHHTTHYYLFTPKSHYFNARWKIWS